MLASGFTLRIILNISWTLVALLCLDSSQVLGQGTYSTRMREDGALVVFEASGNASSRNSSRLELQDAIDRAAQEGIHELVLEAEELVLERSLFIRRSLVISSGQPNSSKTELRCRGVNQIFDIEKRSSGNAIVELRSLRITNCTTPGPDGIVHVSSGASVVFQDVELVNNTAEGSNHSLVVVDSNATLEVRGGSTFLNNQGRLMSVGSGSNVTIKNSSFINNRAEANGTVLATKSGGGIQLTIWGSRFEGNAAEGGRGGVMWLENSSVTLKYGVQFISNVADQDGGALYLRDSLRLQITDTLFENNLCQLGKGGAVFILSSSDSPIGVRRSVFKNNSANGLIGMGGAIAFGNTDTPLRQTLKLEADVLFVKNTARAAGGALFVNGTKSAIESLASFVNNTAQGEGGGIFISSSAYHVSPEEYDVGSVLEASFINNSAPVRGGGAMVVHGGAKFSIMNCNCTNNTAAVGGAVYAYDDVRVSITHNTLFRGNRATENGGSITVFNGRRMTLRLCRFENNSAGVFGGGINVMTTATFNVTNSSFAGNSAGKGGAINIENSEILRGRDTKTTLENVMFSNNLSLKEKSNEGYGGAMRLSGGGLDIHLSSCQFENNKARWGGGIYVDKSFETNIENTKFFSNVADLGGALYVAPLERELRGKDDSTTLDSCTFEANEAIRGGAIFGRPDRPFSGGSFQLSSSLFEIKKSHFYGNRASDAGGGLFLALMTASLAECSFGSNTVNLSDSENTITSQVAITSSAGGALYASDGSSLSVSDTNFIANSAFGRGGAVCIEDALFNCSRSCTFQMNHGHNGGGIYCTLSPRKSPTNQTVLLQCKECSIQRNNAQKGGGVYASIPKVDSNAQQQFYACRRSNNSDIKSTRRYLAAGEGYENLVVLDLDRMQKNRATETGHEVFSTQPRAIRVNTEKGEMNLVEYVSTKMHQESGDYTFASTAHIVKRTGRPLDTLNRGDTGEEMSQLGFEILDHFCQRVEHSRIVVELKACQDGQNCCGNSEQTDNSFIFDGEKKRVIDSGTVNFASLNVSNGRNRSPNQYLWACFEDEGEERAEIDPMFIDVSFRECYTMEMNESTSGGCKECPQDEYYESKTNSCKTCPPHATCRELTIIPEGGYWHATSVSGRIHKCRPRAACIEDKEGHRRSTVTEAHKERRILSWNDSRYNQCSTGYEGIVCGSCKNDHGRWNDVCTECLSIPLMWISFLASVFWNLLVLLVFIYSARSLVDRARYNQLATSQHQETNGISPSLVRQIELFRRTPRITDGFLHSGPIQESMSGSTDPGTTNLEARRWTPSARSFFRRRRFHEIMPTEILPLTNPLSEALKIIINFMQVVYLAALLSEDLPSIVRWSIIPFDALNLSEPVFLIVDCLLKGNEDRAIIRMTLQALFPVLLLLLISLVPGLLLLFTKRSRFGLLKLKLVALCTVYLYSVPEIRTLLKFLDKVKVEDEYASLGASHFWSVDTSVKFLQGSHAVVVGVLVFPLLIAFTICFPLFLFVSLRKHKERMQEEDVVSSYGFLYKGYESNYYYWEIVIVIRKTVIAVVSVFVQNAELQCVFISLTLVLFLSLQLIVRPFSSDFPGLNLLESLSLGVSTSMFLGVSLMLRSHVLGKNQLLYAIAWCTLFVLVATVLGMGIGLFAATQDFLNDKLIEKQLFPDKRSSVLSHLPMRENQQAPAIEVGLERL